MPVIATMHVFGVRRAHVPRALVHMAADRLPLNKVVGLRFVKMLGTGSGRTFAAGDADALHWARFAVWDNTEAAIAYDKCDPWARFATETLRVEMAPLRSNGQWARRDPFGELLSDDRELRDDASSDDDVASREDSALGVAALTRARIRVRDLRAFVRATPPVAATLQQTPGLRLTIGIGEAPVGLQGTFSLWESSAALEHFAYGTESHRAVMAETRRRNWYAEELFARLAVKAIDGTYRGRTP
jgi:hypothetical protein